MIFESFGEYDENGYEDNLPEETEEEIKILEERLEEHRKDSVISV